MRRIPNRFFSNTRCRENLSSGEKLDRQTKTKQDSNKPKSERNKEQTELDERSELLRHTDKLSGGYIYNICRSTGRKEERDNKQKEVQRKRKKKRTPNHQMHCP